MSHEQRRWLAEDVKALLKECGGDSADAESYAHDVMEDFEEKFGNVVLRKDLIAEIKRLIKE